MDMQNVIYAVAVLFIMGIVFAILLGVAAKVFAAQTAAAAASRAVTAWLLRSSRAALRSTAAL